MAKGKAHGEEVKAQVIAALLTGQGVTEVAEAYKLDHSTVSRWKKAIPADKLHELAHKKEERFGELIGQYLTEALTTLSVQARHFRDGAWLQKQSAENLAVLHGVVTDKAIRILEALEAGSEDDTVDATGGAAN